MGISEEHGAYVARMVAAGKKPVSEAGLRQRRNAAKSHGRHAFESRGQSALAPTRISRLSELRQLMATHPGRLEFREELVARLALLVEMGFSDMRKTAERGGDIWNRGAIKTLAGYAALWQRLVDNWPDPKSKGSAIDEEIARIVERLKLPTPDRSDAPGVPVYRVDSVEAPPPDD